MDQEAVARAIAYELKVLSSYAAILAFLFCWTEFTFGINVQAFSDVLMILFCLLSLVMFFVHDFWDFRHPSFINRVSRQVTNWIINLTSTRVMINCFCSVPGYYDPLNEVYRRVGSCDPQWTKAPFYFLYTMTAFSNLRYFFLWIHMAYRLLELVRREFMF